MRTFNSKYFAVSIFAALVLFACGFAGYQWMLAAGETEKGYVLRIKDQLFQRDQFVAELEKRYKMQLKEQLIEEVLLEKEAKEKNVQVSQSEIIDRIRYLMKNGELDHDTSIGDPLLQRKVRNDLLLEKLLMLKEEMKTPEIGYFSYYVSNSARYSELEYRVVMVQIPHAHHEEGHEDTEGPAFIETYRQYGGDFVKAARQYGIKPESLKETWVKEKDLNEELKEALKHTGVNDFVQFHVGDHDQIVWLKERKWTKKPYEAVKDQVKTDYIMEVSKSMKEEYINELAIKYGIVVNTKYFSQATNTRSVSHTETHSDTETHTDHEHHH